MKTRYHARWSLDKALANPHMEPRQYMTGNAGRLLHGQAKRRNWKITLSGGCTLPDGTVFDANGTVIKPDGPTHLAELMPLVVDWLVEIQPEIMAAGGGLIGAGIVLTAECWA